MFEARTGPGISEIDTNLISRISDLPVSSILRGLWCAVELNGHRRLRRVGCSKRGAEDENVLSLRPAGGPGLGFGELEDPPEATVAGRAWIVQNFQHRGPVDHALPREFALGE